ncbi:2-phospho-L-lactate transferase [Sinorhizobium fredii]|uniref:2-phospho-L-lactate transferase n=1 Tax=Rhizobium fredii TaxID=380 RepID=UPI002108ACE1|nr:2-phospho-L-lactate transferase [Sinorhizobium fredii]UTY47295.1 2-phospho-L-lactate transferase [Sinorhizobium fredii]
MTDLGRTRNPKNRIVALCGGVGGAKLALGLSRALGDDLTMIVNTGDDFEHLGLQISPDLDTVLYTLSGLANRELGWGRADESWNFMEVLRGLGSETWFQLGDRDLALHVERTRQLKAGRSLTNVMAEVASRFGISAQILPMSDDPVRTTVITTDGALQFQRYFVERRCAPVVERIVFDGVSQARPTAQVTAALRDPYLRAIVVCPSNPFLSIDPILAVPGLRPLIEMAGVPLVAVSPIIGGKAVKGPTDKIMAELGVPTTSRAIVEHYSGLLDGLVVDMADGSDVADLAIQTHITPALMKTEDDRDRLARAVLDFADRISAVSSPARAERR